MVSSDSLQKSHQLLSFLDHYRKQVVKGDYFKWKLELGKTLDFLKDPTSFLKAKVMFKGLAWRGGISRGHMAQLAHLIQSSQLSKNSARHLEMKIVKNKLQTGG